jgi:phospholipid/cholesterol/gamma-HCH transport system permease protein
LTGAGQVSRPLAQPLHNGWAMIERLGAAILDLLAWIGGLGLFGLRALWQALLPPYEFGELARHIFEIGWRSVPLIATSGLAIGVVLSMHTRASLERFGAEALIPAGLAIALIRETGPLVTALLVSGRVGAGIGAELGAMKVTEQIDALEAVAVDSFKFLAVTRIIACIIAMPLLTAMTDFCGIIGGFLAESAASSMSWELYFRRAFSLIEFSDFLPATLKTTVFGLIIGTVACYLGFNTTQGTEGVGRTSTRAVVLSSILIIVTNVVLVRIIFFFYPAA